MRRPATTFAGLSLTVALVLVACGGDDDETTDATGTSEEGSLVPLTAPGSAPVPSVDVPDESPTELIVTELTPGSGPEAATGDTVLVNYVGVRSEDGTEFDSNFGAEPFPVQLGAGGVITGWDEGLVGATAGERVQLDIPADLAYGDDPRGDVIQPGDALTFVIDVLVVIPPNDPADEPAQSDIPVSEAPVDEVISEDLVDGDGTTVDLGMTAYVNLVLARADNGVVVQDTWTQPAPASLVLAPSGVLDGLIEGMIGMQVGGRRVLTIPYADAFGDAGQPQIGVPAETDVVIIVDVIAAY